MCDIRYHQSMRTLVNLTDEQIEALDGYCREEGVSRAEAVRRAVDCFLLVGRGPKRRLRSHPAFGSWKGRGIDGLELQRRLRREWEP